MVSVLVIRFQLGSAARTVTSIVPPAPKLTFAGVPVLPVTVFGAGLSPGSNTNSWVKFVRCCNAKNDDAGLGKLAVGTKTMFDPPLPKVGFGLKSSQFGLVRADLAPN